MFFPFKIEQEHRLSDQAVVLAGRHGNTDEHAVLKQFDINLESKAFKKELQVLARIQLAQSERFPCPHLPKLLGFAYSVKQHRAELMMNHCGVDLHTHWHAYMENPARIDNLFKM